MDAQVVDDYDDVTNFYGVEEDCYEEELIKPNYFYLSFFVFL